MSKKNVVRNTRQNEGAKVGQAMLAFVAFVFGYLVATVFDFEHVHGWINSKIQAKKADDKVPQETTASKIVPKPKLEFYTLLSQDGYKLKEALSAQQVDPPKDLHTATKQLPVPSTVSQAPKQLGTQVGADVTRYILQVGSFRSRAEADKMRADLVMKGFDVTVVASKDLQDQWYRVMVGPVSSMKEAESLKYSLANREHIDSMIRKVDV